MVGAIEQGLDKTHKTHEGFIFKKPIGLGSSGLQAKTLHTDSIGCAGSSQIAGDYSTSTKILERQALRERLFCSILYQQSKESNQGRLNGNTALPFR